MKAILKYGWIFLLIGGLSSCVASKQSKSAQSIRPVVEKESLSPKQQQKFNYFYLEAERLKLKGDVDDAFELYQHCLEINPTSAEALSALAQFNFYLKNDSLGVAYMEKAVGYEPDNYWYCQNLAGVYQQHNKNDKAIALLKKMLVQFPDNEEPLMALRDIYLQNKDYRNVVDMLNQLEKREGKSEEISQGKLQMYLLLNDNKNAYSEIEGLANEYPDDSRYKCLLGDVYLSTGKKKEAYDIYQKILIGDPHNEQTLMSMMNYYSTTGQKVLFEQQMNTLLLDNEVSVDTRMDVMRQFITNNEQNGADSIKVVSMFEKLMKMDTTDTQMPMLYSQYLIAKSMDKKVVPVLEKIIGIDPTNVPSRLQLLSYAIKDDDYKRAIAICEPALQATPDIVEFYYYLAIAYVQSGDQQKAQDVCIKGLTKVNDQTDKSVISNFYSIIADVYHSKNMYNEAYAAYDSSLVYKPDNVGTLNNYAYYLSEGNSNLDKAEEMSYKTIKAEPNNDTYLDTYAWILFQKKKYSEAKIWIDNAMNNGGNKSNIETEHCGDVYYMNGLKEEALKYWIKAQEMGNQSEVLKKKIEEKKYIAK